MQGLMKSVFPWQSQWTPLRVTVHVRDSKDQFWVEVREVASVVKEVTDVDLEKKEVTDAHSTWEVPSAHRGSCR
jgi:hypothetical protein